MRQLSFDICAGFDKVHGIVVMLFDTGRHGENIGVKNNVFRREADCFSQQFVGTSANFNFPRARIRLPNFIKRHYHHRRTIATNLTRMLDEFILALFHRDRVHNPLALNALQTFFDDFPFGRINHYRHTGNIRLAGDQIKETHHCRFGIEHPFIHIDINDLRTAFYLL